MTDQTHTKEPWTVVEHSWSDTSIVAGGRTVARLSIEDEANRKTQAALEVVMAADARRITACVNALRGIPTAALEAGAVGALIEAAASIVAGAPFDCDGERCNCGWHGGDVCDIGRARRALARLAGREGG